MAIKVIPLNCPKCNAEITLDGDRDFGFCSYCGTRIVLQNDNKFVYRKIDDAAIIKEQNKRYKLETERKEKERNDANLLKIALGVGVMFILTIILVMISEYLGM